MKSKQSIIKFTELFTGMCEVFDKKYSETLMDVYHTALISFTFGQVERSINQAISSCKFFPKPADLIESITGGTSAIEDAGILEAGKVLDAVKHHGSVASVCFDDPVTMAVIRHGFGGWIKLCAELNNQDEKWFRKDFVRTYQAFVRQNVTFEGKLIGIHEMQNEANGFSEHIPETILIGDREKARQIASKTNAPTNKMVKLVENIG